MSNINFNFFPDSTNSWPQTFIDSISDFGGKAFRWIQDTHRNEFVGYGMFAGVTTVSILVADRIATNLSNRIDASFDKKNKTMTPDHKLFKGLLLNGVVTGGLTYAGNLIYSSLSGHRLPQTVMLATAVAACAFRYFLEARREANPILPQHSTLGDSPETEIRAHDESGKQNDEDDEGSLNPSRSTSPIKDVVEERPSSPSETTRGDAGIQFPTPKECLTPFDATSVKSILSWKSRLSVQNDETDSDSDQSTVPENDGNRSSLAGRLASADHSATPNRVADSIVKAKDDIATPNRITGSIVKAKKVRLSFATNDSVMNGSRTPAKQSTNSPSTESNEESNSGSSYRDVRGVHFSIPGDRYADDGAGTPSGSKLRESTPHPNKRPKRKTKTPIHLETDYELSTKKKPRK